MKIIVTSLMPLVGVRLRDAQGSTSHTKNHWSKPHPVGRGSLSSGKGIALEAGAQASISLSPWAWFCPSTSTREILLSALFMTVPPTNLLLTPQTPVSTPAPCWRLSGLLLANLGVRPCVRSHTLFFLLQ